MTSGLSLLVPICGIIISNIQQLSPIRTVLKARQEKDLGPFNPIPVAFILFSLVGWVVYSCALGDYLLLLSCFAGLLVNTLMFTTAISLLALNPERSGEIVRMEAILITAILIWSFLGLLNASVLTVDQTLNIMGFIASSSTIMYYSSPLSALIRIVRTKSTKSLYMPQIGMNMVSVLLWMSYGYSQNNIFIWLPSFVGFWITVLQFTIKFYFFVVKDRSHKDMKSVSANTSGGIMDDSPCYSLHPVSDFIMSDDDNNGDVVLNYELPHVSSSSNLLLGSADIENDIQRTDSESETSTEVHDVPYVSSSSVDNSGGASLYSDLNETDVESKLHSNVFPHQGGISSNPYADEETQHTSLSSPKSQSSRPVSLRVLTSLLERNDKVDASAQDSLLSYATTPASDNFDALSSEDEEEGSMFFSS